MNAREEGFLLLTSTLGDPNRRPLTTAQARNLAQRVAAAPRIAEDRHLECRDLMAMGYSMELAAHIVALLDDTVLLEHYLRRGTRLGCHVISRVGEEYPQTIHSRLKLDAPGCLWMRGNRELLKKLGTVIYLKASVQTLSERLARDTSRPLLQGEEPLEEKITRILSEREALYEEACSNVVVSDGKSIREVAQEIKRLIT